MVKLKYLISLQVKGQVVREGGVVGGAGVEVEGISRSISSYMHHHYYCHCPYCCHRQDRSHSQHIHRHNPLRLSTASCSVILVIVIMIIIMMIIIVIIMISIIIISMIIMIVTKQERGDNEGRRILESSCTRQIQVEILQNILADTERSKYIGRRRSGQYRLIQDQH